MAKPILPPPGALALHSEYRHAMARLQTLCLDITLTHPEYVACFDYAGHVHLVRVDLIPRTNLADEWGGNGSFSSTWSCTVSLPGNPHELDTSEALNKLNRACTHLTGLMAGGKS